MAYTSLLRDAANGGPRYEGFYPYEPTPAPVKPKGPRVPRVVALRQAALGYGPRETPKIAKVE